MRYLKKLGVLVLGLAVALGGAMAQGPGAAEKSKAVKGLTEADVVKLIELQIDDDAIIARLERGGLGGLKVDAALEGRLKKAGASEDVLAAMRRLSGDKTASALPEDPAKASIMVFVRPFYKQACPLPCEMRVNGHLVNRFSSRTQEPIGKHLKMGWNTITLKTTRTERAADSNWLQFSIGATRKKADAVVMTTPLWEMENGTDWKLRDGRMQHRSGPDVKDVTLTYRVYFAGTKYDAGKVKAGDYVLTHQQFYAHIGPVTTTVVVNGTTLTSFVGRVRNQTVLTGLLKKGKNEVRVITKGPTGCLEWNTNDFKMGGPAEWSASKEQFLTKDVIQIKGINGWVKDKKTAQWSIGGKPKADTLEKVETFYLHEAPGGK